MQQLEENREYWFVLGSTSINREIAICDDMTMQKMQAYVPLKYEVKRVRRRQQETLVPAIRGLIFVRATESRLKAYMERSKDRLFFRRSAFSNREDKLIVGDQEMQRFIDFVTECQEDIHFYQPEEINWVEGETVRVTLGNNTYEGKIVRVKGKRRKQFALSIPGTTFATVELTPELMAMVEGAETRGKRPEVRGKRNAALDDRDDHKSKDLEGDKRLLFQTAYRLLFVLSAAPVRGRREYHVAKKELERVMKRVAPYKGMTAAMEGELALPMFLGAMASGENIEAATERMRKAIERLANTSMLKLRMRFYLALLTKDEKELEDIRATISGWNMQKLQRKQGELWKEIEPIFYYDNPDN